MCCDLNRAIPHAWWWLVVAGCLRCMCVRHLFRSYLQPPPHLLFLLSADLRVTVGAATDPYYHPLVLTSPPFRRLLCLHYGTLQPPTWWSSYAATYSPPTYHCCSRPASGPLLVLLPIPTTTPLSYPVTSPPFRRLLCLATLCCLAAHSYPHHGCPPAYFPALLSGQPRIMVTTIDFAPPGLPSYLLASKKNLTHLALRKRTSKYKN